MSLPVLLPVAVGLTEAINFELRHLKLLCARTVVRAMGLLEKPQEFVEGACKHYGVVRELEMHDALRVSMLQC